MKAMILAAGRGERLRPLTDTTPKPLIEIAGTTLIERHLLALARAGIGEIVINVCHLGDLIEARLGDGAAYNLDITYSRESEGPLETAGGIAQAITLLGNAAFIVVNADIWTDFDFRDIARHDASAHLILVSNPPHHSVGDFSVRAGRAFRGTHNSHTYSGIGLYQPLLFNDLAESVVPLAPLLFDLAARGDLSAQVHAGRWFDIGTAERLTMAREAVENNKS
jgi:MurNAc alpha-1-phosphate uridylyltransferase